MKIRNGFVSNSSSASFVLTIADSWQNVYDTFKEEMFPWYHLKSAQKSWLDTLDKNILFLEEMKKRYEKDAEMQEGYVEEIMERLKLRELVNSFEFSDRPSEEMERIQEEFVLLYLSKRDWVTIKTKNDSVCVMTWDTTMFNNCHESTPDSISALILSYVIRGEQDLLTTVIHND
jgi:hypothetical protein